MKVLNIVRTNTKTKNESNGRFIHLNLFNTKYTVKAVIRERVSYWNTYTTQYYRVFNLGKIYLGFSKT